MHEQTGPADPLAAVTHPHPYPYYEGLARAPGLIHDARLGLWIAAHPEDVRRVLADPACLVRPVHEPVPMRIAGPAGGVFGALVRMNDGAGHGVHKAALAAALAAVDDATAVQCAERVAALLLEEGVHDARSLNRFVTALPVGTVASLLGFSDAQLPALAAWTAAFVACLSPLSDDEQLRAAHLATEQLLAALRELCRRTPDDATGLLAAARAAGWAGEHALLSNLLGLLSQSFEATAGLLGNCVVALMRGAAAEDVVARTMRLDPAIHNTRRFTASETRIGDVTVPAHQAILVLLAASGARHGFGHGRHACPGQRLAQTIVEQGVRMLLQACRLPPVSWRYRTSLNARLPDFLEHTA